jgi:Glycogen recognition site of AMP-activated protein kinase
MPGCWHAPAAFLLVVLAGGVARAQTDVSIDGGASHLRQTGLPQADVGTVGARARWDAIRASFATSAISAFTSEGAYTAQGFIAASIYAEPLLSRRWELGGAVSGFGGSSTRPTTSLQALAREHFIGDRFGAFVGIGGGGVSFAQVWRHSAMAQLGGWWRLRPGMFSVATTATDTKSLLHVDVPGAGPYNETHPITYLDGTAFWQSNWDRLELQLGGGVRGGLRNSRATAWGSASAAVWIAPRMALVVSRGRALEDHIRGLPQAQYLAASVRIGFHDHYNATPGAPPSIDATLLSITRVEDGGHHVITVRAGGASMVEIMGDFTDWEPVALVHIGASWQLERELQQGSHRVAVRVDGGPWRVPSNLPRVSDDFGGSVGLVSVP